MKNGLETTDIRQLLRLATQLLDFRTSPRAAARLALERLCGMTGASLGVIGTVQPRSAFRMQPIQTLTTSADAPSAESLIDRPDPLLVAAIEHASENASPIIHPTTRLQRQLIRGMELKAVTLLRHSAGLGEGLYSVLPSRTGMMSVISLHLSRSTARRWKSRDMTLVDVLHPELTWLDQPAPRADADLSDADLPPRQKQTLQLLLNGLSEKQISSSLQLSVHTVHVYVKSIYRKFRVSTRSELLARWVHRPG